MGTFANLVTACVERVYRRVRTVIVRDVRLTGVLPRDAVTVAVHDPLARRREQVTARARAVPPSRHRPFAGAPRDPRRVAEIAKRLAPAGTLKVVVTDRPRSVQRAERRPTAVSPLPDGVPGVAGVGAATAIPSLVAVVEPAALVAMVRQV